LITARSYPGLRRQCRQFARQSIKHAPALRRNASRCRQRLAAFSLFGCAAAYDGWALACHPQVRLGIRRRQGLVETTRVPRPRELAGDYRTRNRRSASTLPPSASLGDVRFAICVQACSTPPRPPQRRLQFAFGSAALCTKQSSRAFPAQDRYRLTRSHSGSTFSLQGRTAVILVAPGIAP
jgi:hypothetical protein